MKEQVITVTALRRHPELAALVVNQVRAGWTVLPITSRVRTVRSKWRRRIGVTASERDAYAVGYEHGYRHQSNKAATYGVPGERSAYAHGHHAGRQMGIRDGVER